MSNKIDESFLSNFARNMAVYVAAKAVSSNSDKIKKDDKDDKKSTRFFRLRP